MQVCCAPAHRIAKQGLSFQRVGIFTGFDRLLQLLELDQQVFSYIAFEAALGLIVLVQCQVPLSGEDSKECSNEIELHSFQTITVLSWFQNCWFWNCLQSHKQR